MHLTLPTDIISEAYNLRFFQIEQDNCSNGPKPPPPPEREDRLGKRPFAVFGTVMDDIERTSYTKNQPLLLG